MKIIYIVKYIAQLGGLDRVMSYKMNYLADKLGYDITLLTYEQGDHPISFPLSGKIKHIDLDVRFFTRYKYGLLKRVYLYLKMRKTFKERLNNQIDLIKPDIIVTLTDSYTLLDILMELHKKSKIVVESHVERNGTIKQTDYPSNTLMHLLTSVYDKYILMSLKKSDAFVALTKADASQWNYDLKKYVIPNPISLDIKTKARLDNKKVIAVGRLEPQKGFDMLINAWKIVKELNPDWRLDIYGDGTLRDSLLQLIQRLGLENTCYINSATDQITEKYLESSIYVMSSRYEGFGLVLIEAMAFGVPCVSFDCPYGPSDIIKDGEDGILVEANNLEKLAQAICNLIESDELRKEYGKKASENVTRYYPEIIMPQWVHLFSSLKK